MNYTMETLFDCLTPHDYYMMGQTIIRSLLERESMCKVRDRYLDFSDKCVLTKSGYNDIFINSFKDVIDVCPKELSGVEYEFLKEIQLSELYLKRHGNLNLTDPRLQNTWNGFQHALAWHLYWKISEVMEGCFDFKSWFNPIMNDFVYAITLDYSSNNFYIHIYSKEPKYEYNILTDLKYENKNSIAEFIESYISHRFDRIKDHIDGDGYIKVVSYYDNQNRNMYSLLNNIDLSHLGMKFEKFKFIKLTCSEFDNINIHVQ